MSDRLDWNEIDLVVFDVDGTLYDQKRLRLAMLGALLADAVRSRSLDKLEILRTFRRIREELGNQAGPDFLHRQYEETASRHGKTSAEVRALVDDWVERRPLPFLAACRYRHVDALFAGLRANGKRIAVFSDYPAADKLAVLGLDADPIVCAGDPDVARLKPDPQGLLTILRRTGVRPERAVMIGDRLDRDGMAARRAGLHTLIRSSRPHPGYGTFRMYSDPIFQPMLANGQASM